MSSSSRRTYKTKNRDCTRIVHELLRSRLVTVTSGNLAVQTLYLSRGGSVFDPTAMTGLVRYPSSDDGDSIDEGWPMQPKSQVRVSQAVHIPLLVRY